MSARLDAEGNQPPHRRFTRCCTQPVRQRGVAEGVHSAWFHRRLRCLGVQVETGKPDGPQSNQTARVADEHPCVSPMGAVKCRNRPGLPGRDRATELRVFVTGITRAREVFQCGLEADQGRWIVVAERGGTNRKAAKSAKAGGEKTRSYLTRIAVTRLQ